MLGNLLFSEARRRMMNIWPGNFLDGSAQAMKEEVWFVGFFITRSSPHYQSNNTRPCPRFGAVSDTAEAMLMVG